MLNQALAELQQYNATHAIDFAALEEEARQMYAEYRKSLKK